MRIVETTVDRKNDGNRQKEIEQWRQSYNVNNKNENSELYLTLLNTTFAFILLSNMFMCYIK